MSGAPFCCPLLSGEAPDAAASGAGAPNAVASGNPSDSKGTETKQLYHGTMQPMSIKIYVQAILVVFLAFLVLVVVVLWVTGALPHFLHQMEDDCALYVLAANVFVTLVLLLVIHLRHAQVQFAKRLNALKANTKTESKGIKRMVSIAAMNTYYKRHLVAVVFFFIVGLLGEIEILYLVGALNKFLMDLKLYMGVIAVALAVITLVVSLICVKGYAIYKYFIEKFDDLEQDFVNFFEKGVESLELGIKKDVHQAADEAKAEFSSMRDAMAREFDQCFNSPATNRDIKPPQSREVCFVEGCTIS